VRLYSTIDRQISGNIHKITVNGLVLIADTGVVIILEYEGKRSKLPIGRDGPQRSPDVIDHRGTKINHGII
jgi:hypothetical protein